MRCHKCEFEIPETTSICPNCRAMRSLSLDFTGLKASKGPKRTAMDNFALLALLFSLASGITAGIISGSLWLGIITFLLLHGLFIYNHMNIRTKLKLDKKCY